MKICMPVENNNGFESLVYGHFGSAPGFMVFDTDTNELKMIENNNEHHQHGACNPLLSFQNVDIDFFVVGGIGGGALMKLNQAGIRVFQAAGSTVKDNVDAIKTTGLPEFTMNHTCQGHSAGGCGSH